jgi:sarcosine oxidase, subunit gamma
MLETKHAVRRFMALTEPPQQSVRPDLRAGIAIRALAGEARFSLRLGAVAARTVGEVAGFRLDIPLNSHAGSGERSAARLGPDEWLLIAADGEAEIVPGQIETALAGHFYGLVDVGHRNVGIQVVGRHASEVLNSGCPLDLAKAAFPTGSATRTLLGKAEIVLMRLEDTPTYRVECWRSFAPYVHEYLLEAAREFEPVSR